MSEHYGTDGQPQDGQPFGEQPTPPPFEPKTEQPFTEQPAEQPTDESTDKAGPTRTEQFTVSGEKLLGKVKELIAEGNVRRIILTTTSGNTLLEIPLNAGLAVTAVAAVFAPVLVAVGAVAALVTSVSVTVVREAPSAVAHDTVEDTPAA
ncbi:MAG TPA: hypothetical protein DHV14_01550 [Micrococcales bacterium]|uniref:DUF4342 domain-containing protein n=1 Tax=Miniimonas arenae TaxID=676201 RepID=A0A5C5BFC0_9MICO|nr:DUF4342 domain-containing protein [Miniimonas arenae]TNU76290.1 DUF4342 domain-containing protein [Miniimonas arenae]HCX83828.1 hypothetical protein [Micrococcales bacterium]